MFCSVIGFKKYASEVDFIQKWVGSRVIFTVSARLTFPYLSLFPTNPFRVSRSLLHFLRIQY